MKAIRNCCLTFDRQEIQHDKRGQSLPIGVPQRRQPGLHPRILALCGLEAKFLLMSNLYRMLWEAYLVVIYNEIQNVSNQLELIVHSAYRGSAKAL